MDRGEGACAVSSTTDLARHARLLHRAHDAAMAGEAPPGADLVRRVVRRSWARTRACGVDPDPRPGKAPAGPEEIEARRASSPLTPVMPELRASLTSIAESVEHIMVVTAADGFVLYREGSVRVGRGAEALGFSPGADWTESSVGTNAIGTALAESAPVQLFSAEHFVRNQHPWTCTACPVHDPRTGELLGVVDLSGPAATVHPTTVALVGTAVRLAESTLWVRHESRLAALRGVGAPLLARTRGPGLVVDEHGWVAASSGVGALERVAVPEAGRPAVVHGLGACVPEPVPGGWLLRAATSGPARVRLRLDLAGPVPHAVVEGSLDDVRRHPLSRRHAQLLALLIDAGPAGLDAGTLSLRVHGDRDHQVTVRAELSRLRRVVGNLVTPRPYRIAAGVEAVGPAPEAVRTLLS